MALKFSKLTREGVRDLKAGQRLAEHGITVERMSNRDLRYSVNIMVDGQRIHRVVGRESEGVTREQCERTIESLRTRAREDRLDLPKGRKTHRTFAQAATEYMARLEATLGRGQKGFEDLPNKRRNLDRYLIPFFGKRRADKVTSFAVQNYKKHRLDEGAKLASINRELATLSHFMRRMVEWEWMKDKDRPAISKDDEPRKQIVVLTPQQAEALYQGAVADQDPDTALFVAIGLNTAMRHSEILRIRWRDIDFDRRRLYIARAKAGAREQPITADLAAMLRREFDQRQNEEWIFPATRSDSREPHRLDMRRQFARAAERAKLDPAKCTPHVMRHTGITRLVKAGVDIPTIQRISGHKTLAMVMRYVHLDSEHIDDAIEKISGKVTPELHTATEGSKTAPVKAANANG